MKNGKCVRVRIKIIGTLGRDLKKQRKQRKAKVVLQLPLF
jgi:hypothetical protein